MANDRPLLTPLDGLAIIDCCGLCMLLLGRSCNSCCCCCMQIVGGLSVSQKSKEDRLGWGLLAKLSWKKHQALKRRPLSRKS